MFPGDAEMWLKLIRTNVTGPIQMELLVKKYVTTSEESFDAVYEEARTNRKKQMPSPSPPRNLSRCPLLAQSNKAKRWFTDHLAKAPYCRM